MLNRNTSRPTLEPSDNIGDVCFYLRKRIEAMDKVLAKKETRKLYFQRAEAVRSELVGMLIALDPTSHSDWEKLL